MPGFLISKEKKINSLKNYKEDRCISGEFSSCGWNVQWNVLNKFTSDNCFSENEKYILVLQGLILNKNELLHKYENTDWKVLLFNLIEKDACFFREFRGAFSGAYYDKKEKKWTVFTDQLGNHLVLYYQCDDGMVFGSQMNYISDWMKTNQQDREISNDWVNDFLSFGYMRDSHTVIEGCKRIFPGCYIIYDEKKNEKVEEIYYRVKKSDCNLNENQIIDKLDEIFKQAVDRVAKKCIENNFKMVLDVSGGLDSRMIVAVIKELGYEKDVIGINYAQDGSSDQKISKTVSQKYDVELMQFLMDSGNCIKEIDDLMFMNQGFNYYIGITGGRYVLENLDRDTYGVELWGILGDIYEGAMIVEDDLSELKWDYPRFRTSTYFPIVNRTGYTREYQDNEVMWFYIRGMLAGENTAFIRQNFVEAPAVYGDVEFLDFIFSIPYELRTKGHIYRKWMKKYYPDACDIIYSHNNVKVCVNDKEEKFRAFPYKINNRIKRIINRKSYEKTISMNPIDYWLKNNSDLMKYIDIYFDKNICVMGKYPKLRDKVTQLFASNNSFDKIVALSMISAMKQYIF